MDRERHAGCSGDGDLFVDAAVVFDLYLDETEMVLLAFCLVVGSGIYWVEFLRVLWRDGRSIISM